jgi:glycosyltransferase involved in cell wall biosynthesis
MSIDVSIVIPNYNGARFLREAIDSALSQQGVRTEVIVVDDGSTDDSRAILESYGDQICVIFQANRGAATARNTGLAAAKAAYLKFLDSDDMLLPGALSQQYRFHQAASSTWGDRWINFGNCIRVDEKSTLSDQLYYQDLAVNTEFGLLDLVSRSPITSKPLHQTHLLREVGGFTESLACNDEYDLHLRLYLAGTRFIFDGINAYAYRYHSGSGRLSQSRLKGAALAALFDAYHSQVESAQKFSGEAFTREVKQAFAETYWQSGRWALRSGQAVWADQFFCAARELSPSPESGSSSYRKLCRLIGPASAEKVAAMLRRLS